VCRELMEKMMNAKFEVEKKNLMVKITSNCGNLKCEIC
jgi:hypothetical protein